MIIIKGEGKIEQVEELRRTLTNDWRRKVEIKARTVTAKQEFNKKEEIILQQNKS